MSMASCPFCTSGYPWNECSCPGAIYAQRHGMLSARVKFGAEAAQFRHPDNSPDKSPPKSAGELTPGELPTIVDKKPAKPRRSAKANKSTINSPPLKSAGELTTKPDKARLRQKPKPKPSSRKKAKAVTALFVATLNEAIEHAQTAGARLPTINPVKGACDFCDRRREINTVSAQRRRNAQGKDQSA